MKTLTPIVFAAATVLLSGTAAVQADEMMDGDDHMKSDMQHETMADDGMGKASMHDDMKKDAMHDDGMMKDDGMQDEMHHDDMKDAGMNGDDMKQDAMQ